MNQFMFLLVKAEVNQHLADLSPIEKRPIRGDRGFHEWAGWNKWMVSLPADWKTSEQLVLQGFGLSNSAETSGGDLLGVELI